MCDGAGNAGMRRQWEQLLAAQQTLPLSTDLCRVERSVAVAVEHLEGRAIVAHRRPRQRLPRARRSDRKAAAKRTV